MRLPPEGIDRRDDVGVAVAAGALGDRAVVRLDLERIGKAPVVKARECQKPLDALATYLPTMSWGMWQSAHPATARWLDRCQAAIVLAHDVAVGAAGRIGAQIRGAFAYTKVKAPSASAVPIRAAATTQPIRSPITSPG